MGAASAPGWDEANASTAAPASRSLFHQGGSQIGADRDPTARRFLTPDQRDNGEIRWGSGFDAGSHSASWTASLTGTATRSRRPFRGLKEIRGIIQPEPARERLPAQKHYEPPKKVGTVGGVK